jgi:outer membrane protein
LITDNLTLIPAVGLTWQDSELVDHFYGVQANEVIPGRTLYRAESTINYNLSLTTSLTTSWNITNNIELLGFIKYESLGDEIQDSPIVDETEILLSAIGLVYRF